MRGNSESRLSGPATLAKTGQHVEEWTAPAFEVQSDRIIAAGIDGEAVQLEPPLRFRSRHCCAARPHRAPASRRFAISEPARRCSRRNPPAGALRAVAPPSGRTIVTAPDRRIQPKAARDPAGAYCGFPATTQDTKPLPHPDSDQSPTTIGASHGTSRAQRKDHSLPGGSGRTPARDRRRARDEQRRPDRARTRPLRRPRPRRGQPQG